MVLVKLAVLLKSHVVAMTPAAVVTTGLPFTEVTFTAPIETDWLDIERLEKVTVELGLAVLPRSKTVARIPAWVVTAAVPTIEVTLMPVLTLETP
jgi:hypothetical protein